MSGLNHEEVARYRDQGILVPDYRLSDVQLSALREALEAVIAANPDIRPERLVSVHIDGKNREGISGNSAFLDLARDSGIVDRVAQVIGDDVILWGCQIFCKPAGDGMEVPWHQDGHYWPIRPLATCSVWVALDDSLVDNGCLRVVPGSHSGGELHPHLKEDRTDLTLNQRICDGLFSEKQALDVELRAGEMSMHDVFMIHGSNPNRSARRRAGVALRYMPASSHFDRDLYKPSDGSGYQVDFSTRPLWLLRGSDRCGRNDFSIGHDIGAAS